MVSLPIPSSESWEIELFACMSRFEFALKEAGFVAGVEGERAQPNWEGFGKWAKTQNAFGQLSSLPAVRPLIDGPPRKQLRRGDAAEWGDPLKVRNFDELSVAIRQVRNNLFHGGKAGADPRDENLCKAATAAILFLASLHPDVRAAFLGEC